MVQVNQEKLINAIIRSYRCKLKEAQLLANYTKGLSDRLQPVLDAWIADGTIIDFEINGVDIPYIMSKVEVDFLGSLVTMNRFINNPAETEKFKRVRFMNRDAKPSGGHTNA